MPFKDSEEGTTHHEHDDCNDGKGHPMKKENNQEHDDFVDEAMIEIMGALREVGALDKKHNDLLYELLPDLLARHTQHIEQHIREAQEHEQRKLLDGFSHHKKCTKCHSPNQPLT